MKEETRRERYLSRLNKRAIKALYEVIGLSIRDIAKAVGANFHQIRNKIVEFDVRKKGE